MGFCFRSCFDFRSWPRSFSGSWSRSGFGPRFGSCSVFGSFSMSRVKCFSWALCGSWSWAVFLSVSESWGGGL